MNNDYQIGKDIGDILRRLEKLENDDCGCGGDESKQEFYDETFENNESENDEIELSYNTYPIRDNIVHVSLMIRKDDELLEFMNNRNEKNSISFAFDESDEFAFYSTVTSIEKIEDFENRISDFLNSKEELKNSGYTYSCRYSTGAFPDCRGRRREFLRCKTRGQAWSQCSRLANRLCPYGITRRGRCN